MRHVTTGILLPAVLAAACAPAATPDPSADREAIAAVSAQFEAAENAGDVGQMRALFADDMVMLGPNTPAVTGADEVAARMGRFHDAIAVEVDFDSEEIVAFGDWGFDRGTYHYTATPRAGGDSFQENGKYLWLYRRQVDGAWKQSRVMWSSSDPLPPSGD